MQFGLGPPEDSNLGPRCLKLGFSLSPLNTYLNARIKVITRTSYCFQRVPYDLDMRLLYKLFQLDSRKIWISFIHRVIWVTENTFFYPKLFRAYKKLRLTPTYGNNLIVFDVGAHHGQSIRFFKRLYPDAEFFSFEPQKNSYKILGLRVAKWRYKGISTYPFGLGDVTKTIDFHESVLSETSTFVLPNKDSKYLKKKNRFLFQKKANSFKSVLTNITTLDNFVRENKVNMIDILKIDVEGFELNVIWGANVTLTQNKINVLQIENQRNDMRQNDYLAIDTFLKERNYCKVAEIRHPFGSFYELLYKRG